ncbi:OmpH family outer membrane protein [Sulfitobacter aestuariivivens]|uniref:OmpH family outer membrane protein n=1 Tax=Sulfitobacter aestuariivivens TaxID=2766981 RepID=UPI00361D7012
MTLIGVAPAHAQQQPSVSQQLDLGLVVSEILTIDSDRLFLESAFGQRVLREAEARGQELAAENSQIQAELEAEEMALTEQRPTLSPEEFRDLADAFDTKVQETRAAQASKSRAISMDIERAREIFRNASAPVLEQLMRDAGAVIILERRSYYLSVSEIEITDVAIALLNETLGSGVDAD